MDNNPLEPNNSDTPNPAPQPDAPQPTPETPAPQFDTPAPDVTTPAAEPIAPPADVPAAAPNPLDSPAPAPASTPPIPGAPVSPQPSSTPGASKSPLKLIAILSAALVLIVAAGVAAFVFLKPLTPEEAYYQALKNNISLPSDSKIAVSVEAKSGDTEISATGVGTPGAKGVDGSKGTVKGVSIDTPYGKVKLDMDVMYIGSGDSRKNYSKITSMSSTDKMLNDQLKDSTNKKWQLTTGEDDTDSKDANDAGDFLNTISPNLSLNSKDATTYVDEAKKAQIFKIGKEAVDATFKDQKVKEIGITVSKDAYGKFLANVNNALSDEGKKQVGKTVVNLDKIFGKNNEVSARVYIKGGKILGLKTNLDLPQFGSDDSTKTDSYEVIGSIEYNTSLKIEAPKDSEVESA